MESFLFAAIGAVLTGGLLWARTRYGGFLAQSPDDYATDRVEPFDLRRHLNGPMVCEGVIYGPFGRVSSRFVARFEAEWTGNRGVMEESFRYDDGTTQDRAWHLSIGNDGTIRAEAADVVGQGTGRQSGGTVQLKYRIRLPESAGGHVLDTVDWMYLVPNGTIVNRSQFRKYGIKVAELVATMRPADTMMKEAA